MKKRSSKLLNNQGSILILTLWTILMLSVLSLGIGANARQKLTLISRVEKRQQLKFIADAGIQKAIAVLKADFDDTKPDLTPLNKFVRHNNKHAFQDVEIGSGIFNVDYPVFAEQEEGLVRKIKYGVADEGSKLNLNYASADEIRRLLIVGLKMDEDEAKSLGNTIADWRMLGTSQITGFFSDDFYESLEHPYETKDEKYERVDELLLVQGMNPKIFDHLRNYVTVYGGGKININTASYPVLVALGLSEQTASKLLAVRKGADGVDGSLDDFIFTQTHRVIPEIQEQKELEQSEVDSIDKVNFAHRFSTTSRYFSISSSGSLKNSEEKKVINCVYDLINSKIVYWREY